MGISVPHTRIQANLLEHSGHHCATLVRSEFRGMNFQSRFNDLVGRQSWRQTSERVLEDDLDLVAK